VFRTQSASIFRSNFLFFLQTVVAATGVCYRYGVDKSRTGVIGSVCIIPGSIDVDGLAMLHLVGILKTSITKMHGTMNIKFLLNFSTPCM